MSYISPCYREVKDRLAMLTDGIYFGTNQSDRMVEFQAGDLKDVQDALASISIAFRCSEPWRTEWEPNLRWWDHHNVSSDGIPLRLYGDTSQPSPDGGPLYSPYGNAEARPDEDAPL